MSKKTLIIVIGIIAIVFSYWVFENKLSQCRQISRGLYCRGVLDEITTIGNLAIVFLTRVGVIVLVSGGLLFLLGRRADEKVSFGVVLKGVKEKIRFLFPYNILVYIGVVLISFLIVVGIVYLKSQNSTIINQGNTEGTPIPFTRPIPSPAPS